MTVFTLIRAAVSAAADVITPTLTGPVGGATVNLHKGSGQPGGDASSSHPLIAGMNPSPTHSKTAAPTNPNSAFLHRSDALLEGVMNLDKTPMAQALKYIASPLPVFVPPHIANIAEKLFMPSSATRNNKLPMQPRNQALEGYLAEPNNHPTLHTGGSRWFKPERKEEYLIHPETGPKVNGKPLDQTKPLTIAGKPAEILSTPQLLLWEEHGYDRKPEQFENPDAKKLFRAFQENREKLQIEMYNLSQETKEKSLRALLKIDGKLRFRDGKLRPNGGKLPHEHRALIDKIAQEKQISIENINSLLQLTEIYATHFSKATNHELYETFRKSRRASANLNANTAILSLPEESLNVIAKNVANKNISFEEFAGATYVAAQLASSIDHLNTTMYAMAHSHLKDNQHLLDQETVEQLTEIESRFATDSPMAFRDMMHKYFINTSAEVVPKNFQIHELANNKNKLSRDLKSVNEEARGDTIFNLRL